MANQLTLVKIYDITKSDNWIQKLQEWGLIPAEPHYKCPNCESPLRFVPYKHVDGYAWRCQEMVSKRKQTAKSCNTSISMRVGSFFAGSKLSLFQILGFVNLWVDNVPLHIIEKQLEMNKNSVTDWSSFCREVVFDSMIVKKQKLGGIGKTVEIDESKFGKRKYHRGHKVEGQWVFGGIEEESGNVFMVPVETRDSATLIPIIKDWILPGTTIVSDCWKSYDCLKDEGYDHLKVNHSVNFKDPETGAHTNRIEASWRSAKVTILSGSRRKPFFPSHLAKYMFMKMCRIQKLDPTVAFYRMAGELYNPIHSSEETSVEERDVDENQSDNDFD